jgi:hypothetical protein
VVAADGRPALAGRAAARGALVRVRLLRACAAAASHRSSERCACTPPLLPPPLLPQVEPRQPAASAGVLS